MATYTGSTSPPYIERQENLNLQLYPSLSLVSKVIHGWSVTPRSPRRQKRSFSHRSIFHMQRRLTFSHCKENRTKGSDYSVLPANMSKLCPGSTSGKYQLELNTKLYYFSQHRAKSAEPALTVAGWRAGLGKRNCLDSLPQ